MASERNKILLFAFTCNPFSGSESKSGWERALEISKEFETWVVTEQQNECDIRKYCDMHGNLPGLHILYVKKGRLEEKLFKCTLFFYLDYNTWHRRAYRLARILHMFIQFGLVHHLTICGFREPGYLYKLDIPYIWGPIGGMQYYPWRFLAHAGVGGAVIESLRNITNFIQFRFGIRVRKSLHKARVVLAANSSQKRYMELAHNVKPALLPEAGIRDLKLNSYKRDTDGPLKILWSGEFQHRKALHLLIHALSRLPKGHDYRLRVLGCGKMEGRWRDLIKKTGVEPHCEWLGWQPHKDAVRNNEWADVLVFTSLSDTTGVVVLEALSHGVPVVCFDHHGAGEVVTDRCGVKIQVTTPEEAISRLSGVIAEFCKDRSRLRALSSGALERAREFLWSNNCRKLFLTYNSVLKPKRAKTRPAGLALDRAARPYPRPMVSVIVINRNREASLKRCLESIGMQSYRPMEVIVLDHGSTDGSPSLIDEFRSEAGRKGVQVRCLSSKLMGVASSRNYASRFAEGDILCFIDNDACLLQQDDLGKAADVFESTPSCALISFRILKGDTSDIDPFAWVYRRPKEVWADRTFGTFTFAGGGFSIRRKAFMEAGGFWEHLTYSREEEDLGLALIERGWEISYCPAITIRHYFDPAGRSSTIQRRRTELHNGLIVLWRRFPVPLAIPAMSARVITMLSRNIAREKDVVKHLLPAVPAAVRDWRANRLQRSPISLRAAFKYFALHLSKQKAG